MASPEIVEDLGCVNPECRDYGLKGHGNLSVRRRYGPDDIRFVRCRTCKREFSERHSTPLFDLRIPKEKVIAVVKHLSEGTGIRRTARLTDVSRDTVARIARRVGKHAKAVHDALVTGLEISEIQFDEMWSFVGKKTRTARLRRENEGM